MTNDDGRKPEGAPERSPKAGVGAPSGVDGNGPKRFSVQRKMAIVARLLRGEPLELVARETNVSIARLTEWRERALAGAATALKERERDDRDDEIARLKSKVGEITMDNELLYAKIEALEGKRSPSFVREPEGNGVAERFIRTWKENRRWVRIFDTMKSCEPHSSSSPLATTKLGSSLDTVIE